jgi:hypothetical protein
MDKKREEANLRRNSKRRNKWEAFKEKYLIGTQCLCGEDDPLKLTFHHIDPSEKDYQDHQDSMQSFVKNKTSEEIALEITKCMIMCQNCHMLLHNGETTDALETLIDRYTLLRSQKLSRSKQKLRKKQYATYRRILLLILKNDYGCEKCGCSEGRCCVFHHIDSKSKSRKVSSMVKSSFGSFVEEIGKTCILCYNCHQAFHTLYGRKTDKEDLAEYLGYTPVPINVDIVEYENRLKEILR